MPIVSVPPPYRGPTHGESEIRVEGATVRDCLEAVDARHPGFAELIFDAGTRVHRSVRLFLNDEAVAPDALDAPVEPEDTVSVVAAIGGG